jgi:hypothetical protein
MHAREGDDVFEALELAHDERAVCPGAGVRDVEVVPSCFWWELAAFLDEVAELRLAALELAGFVVGCYPVGDLFFGLWMVRLALKRGRACGGWSGVGTYHGGCSCGEEHSCCRTWKRWTVEVEGGIKMPS